MDELYCCSFDDNIFEAAKLIRRVVNQRDYVELTLNSQGFSLLERRARLVLSGPSRGNSSCFDVAFASD